ncbi:MAG TPA: GGDEF domain-containing protein [Methylothermaceae bacterium]|nr:GGDEF domain-containing protein [Methylothermaceae bacterium]
MPEDKISFIPRYHETPEQAAEYLRLTLPWLAKFKLPMNPINYAIGYDYIAGNNRLLREAIDNLTKNQQSLTEAHCIQFYRQYILDEAARRFEKVGDSLSHLVQQTLQEVEKTEAQASQSSVNLEEQAQALSTQPPEKIAEVLQNVIQETRALAETGSQLKNNLHYTNLEITQLRAELEMMKEAAFTDALTGLLNRRAFDMRIQHVVAMFPHEFSSVFLLILDLDHFKKINDNFGHLTGDKVLRFTAHLIKKYLPKGQAAARYGGEEIAILLANVNREEAINVAENIRSELAKSRLQRKDNGEPIGQVTVSVGVASLREGDSIDDLIERADTALYEAKKQGRNRVVDSEQSATAA